MANNLDKQYTNLLQDILDEGFEKTDRTGTGTISVFGRSIRHNMLEGFPLLTTKKMAWKSMAIELIWFLRGDTNIKFLVENDCNIWNGDAYKKYLSSYMLSSNGVSYKNGDPNQGPCDMDEFIEKIKTDSWFCSMHGDLGAIYGKQWRTWGGYIKSIMYGYIVKVDGEWVIKWSDLHKFHGGHDWCYTPIKDSSGLTESDIERRVAFKFEPDYNPFQPYKYAIIDPNPKKEYVDHIDQIANAINLLKTNPDSRRIMVNAWNVSDLEKMTLPPCHYGFQLYTRDLTYDEFTTYYSHELWQDIAAYQPKDKTFNEYAQEAGIATKGVSLIWNQRSVDTFLGLPFNIASYGLLLQIIAEHVNMAPLELIGNLGDTHLYLNHIDQAKEQITRDPYQLPTVKIKSFDKIEDLSFEHFKLIGYKSHERIKAPLSN